MIPKTIHYCWFGNTEKPQLAKKCIKSWKKRCPDYQIIEWNEDNYDVSKAPLYVKQAYEAKKWAFVTDYVRLDVVYTNGGIYLDTDVELLKKPDELLKNRAYFGFEDGKHIATGLGFGAEKGAPILPELMDDYKDIPFILSDGSLDTKSCPQRNTEAFLRHGLLQNDEKQVLDNEVLILPTEYLSPINYFSGEKKVTRKSISIHWYAASWHNSEQKEYRKRMVRDNRRRKWKNRVDYLIHTPNRLGIKVLGEERYNKLKQRLKR